MLIVQDTGAISLSEYRAILQQPKLEKNIEILIQTFSPFSNLKGAEKYLDLS
jgi:hypothetical protein